MARRRGNACAVDRLTRGARLDVCPIELADEFALRTSMQGAFLSQLRSTPRLTTKVQTEATQAVHTAGCEHIRNIF